VTTDDKLHGTGPAARRYSDSCGMFLYCCVCYTECVDEWCPESNAKTKVCAAEMRMRRTDARADRQTTPPSPDKNFLLKRLR